jgi:Fe-S-cluster-containing hydrogenase component 2
MCSCDRRDSLVFIDEESCIGCMMCVNVAPAGKLMLDLEGHS